MNLQFADFDADGREDIVTATWEGTPFLVRGSESAWATPEHITDKNGAKIYLSRYYDFDGNRYTNAVYGEGDETIAGDHLVSCLAWDIDADGDLDLLLGAKKGQLYLRENFGSKARPRFGTKNKKLTAGGADFAVRGGMTAAELVDWDGDGVLDLVCGSFDGGAYLFRNAGKHGAPRFEAPKTLLAAKHGEGPESAWYVDVCDYDGDGRLDLLVGGQRMTQPKRRTLGAEETTELMSVRKRHKSLVTKLSALIDAARRGKESEAARTEAVRAVFKTAEYVELTKKRNELQQRIQELAPTPKRVSGVWLYRQVAADPKRDG